MHVPHDQPIPDAPAQVQRSLSALLTALLVRRGEGLAIKDLDSGTYLLASEEMASFVGRPGSAMVQHSDSELFEPAVAAALRAADHAARSHDGVWVSDHRIESPQGRIEASVLRLVLPGDEPGRRWLCSVWTDIGPERQRETQLRTAIDQIEQMQRANDVLRRQLADQALRDDITGLYRQTHFEDQLRREVDMSLREHREFSVVLIAVDPPGPRVLERGAAGSRSVLEAVGRLLRSGTRAMDASCRYDEHRFAVLLSGVGLATAHSRMEGLRRKCQTQVVVQDGFDLGFTVAMGVASFPHTAQTQEALMQACEAALAEAQRRGGNHVTLAAIRLDPGEPVLAGV
jgi:diguanylate cyclase (GGDEF)-like protein